MTLQDKLDAFKADFEANQAPPDAIAAFHRSTQELIDQRLADNALKVGDMAPEFNLLDADGNTISLKALLASGPVVLTFYRGNWCPYCNLELKALEEVVGDLRARGASLVAISQQSQKNSQLSQRQNDLSFPIVTDPKGDTADAFGLRWDLQPYLTEVFKTFNVDLPLIQEDDKWTLPMPARYVIAQDGSIVYAEVNPDYTQRPEPSDLFTVLDGLANRAA
ncbi:MAG: peroxiredoxin-like family protein [Pseudomonadota bacterium]